MGPGSEAGATLIDVCQNPSSSFRDGPKDQTRNLEIPGSRFARPGMTAQKKSPVLRPGFFNSEPEAAYAASSATAASSLSASASASPSAPASASVLAPRRGLLASWLS